MGTSSRVAIFIDGGYLDWTLMHELNRAQLDYKKFSEKLAEGRDLLRTYYYHCEPWQSNPPTTEEAQRFSNMQRFLHRLKTFPNYEIRLGKLAFRGINQSDGKPILEQKRVDITLGVDMVLLSTKQRIEHAVLVAGDSDFLPAVQVARDEGVTVHLNPGARPHQDLWDRCDQRTQINAAFISSLLR